MAILQDACIQNLEDFKTATCPIVTINVTKQQKGRDNCYQNTRKNNKAKKPQTQATKRIDHCLAFLVPFNTLFQILIVNSKKVVRCGLKGTVLPAIPCTSLQFLVLS